MNIIFDCTGCFSGEISNIALKYRDIHAYLESWERATTTPTYADKGLGRT